MSAISVYNRLTEKVPKLLPQKPQKINSHKYFHGKSGFAALCCEVVFLHIRKNLLGHFSKMDKERACPKSKNAPLSLSNVFMWAKIVGTNSKTLWKRGRRSSYTHNNGI
jgi:hypothetical protein